MKKTQGFFCGGTAALRASSLLLNNLTHISVGLSPQEGSCKPARLPAQEVPFIVPKVTLKTRWSSVDPTEELSYKGYKDTI